MKVVINKCFGGFSISNEGYEWLIKNKGWTITQYKKSGSGYVNPKAQLVETDDGGYYLTRDEYDDINIRTNPDLIEMVETLGKEGSANVSNLQIVEIPDDVKWHVEEYDGNEHIAEDHRTW